MSLNPDYYACYNRSNFATVYPVQDGNYLDGYTRTPRMIPLKTFGARECQYTKFQLNPQQPHNRDDVRCAGCARNAYQIKAKE